MTTRKTDPDAVKEEIASIVHAFGRAEDKMRWVRCPICHEEWTKLMQCRVWMDTGEEKKKELTTSMCVSCAENPYKFREVAHTWPLYPGHEGLEFSRRLPHSCKNLPRNMIEPSMWISSVSISESFIFEIQKRGNGLIVRGTGIAPEQPLYFDTSVSAWFWIRDRFEKGEPKESKKGW